MSALDNKRSSTAFEFGAVKIEGNSALVRIELKHLRARVRPWWWPILTTRVGIGWSIRFATRAGLPSSFMPTISEPKQVEAMIKTAIDRFGQLDILHDNAITATAGHIGEIGMYDALID